MDDTTATMDASSASRDVERFVRHFDAGEIIFSQGEPGRCMYVVTQGVVEICAEGAPPGAPPLKRLEAGDCFGEIALLEDGVRTATARAAAAPTRVAEIDKARFIYLVGQQPAFALTVMRNLARRVQGRNTPS